MAKNESPQPNVFTQMEYDLLRSSASKTKFSLVTNYSLARVITQLKNLSLNWGKSEIGDDLWWYPAGKWSNRGTLAEKYLRHELENIAQTNLKARMLPFPTHPISTKHYNFLINPDGSIRVIDKILEKSFVKYDAITEVNGLPVVWKIKLDITKLPNLLDINSPQIRRIFSPLQEYYQRSDFGYVILTKNTAINSTNPHQQRFIQNGGHLVPLYPVTLKSLINRVQLKMLEAGINEPPPKS